MSRAVVFVHGNAGPMDDCLVPEVSAFGRVIADADWSQKRGVLKLYRSCKDLEAGFGAIASRASFPALPVCVVWGERDPYLPSSFAEGQKELFPAAEVHVLAGLGHWPFIDDPEAVKACVLPFLRKQLGSGSPETPTTSPR